MDLSDAGIELAAREIELYVREALTVGQKVEDIAGFGRQIRDAERFQERRRIANAIEALAGQLPAEPWAAFIEAMLRGLAMKLRVP